MTEARVGPKRELWTPPPEGIQSPFGALWIPSYTLERMEHALSLEGPGVLRVEGALNEDFRQDLLTEIGDPNRVVLTDAGHTYINARGVEVVQNHTVFALKLSAGDPAPIQNVPHMRLLAAETEALIRSLHEPYPSLATWEADEMSYHVYYDTEVGLSPHRDNLRFYGLVAVVVMEGESDFQVLDRVPVRLEYDPVRKRDVVVEWNIRGIYTIPARPGDLILMRAPGLIPNMRSEDRPEHGVVNCKLPRISFMLRANDKPDDTADGFEYYNWQTDRSSS